MKKKEIYLDNAATTPVDSAVLKKMQPYFNKKYGNSSSIHKAGDSARKGLDEARQQISTFLNCLSEEIYFTGGATESNNWLIYGVVDKFWENGGKNKPHIIISSIEHKAIIEPAKYLEEKNLVEVTILPVNKQGIVELNEVKKAIKKNTILVSVMYANSEIGSIQPIKQIGELIKKTNQEIVFHTDAVQAINYLNCNVKYLNVDALSISGHKIYGPKGVGALYLKKGIPIAPLIRGGGQEHGLRSGTENIPGIVGLGEAINLVSKNNKDNNRIKTLRNKLITGIMKDIPDVQLNGTLEYRLPNNINFSFLGIEGEGILIELSEQGIYVSTGSACASHSLKPSHVLSAIGLSDEESHSSVRFTLGRQTSNNDIDYVLNILIKAVNRLRKISGR